LENTKERVYYLISSILGGALMPGGIAQRRLQRLYKDEKIKEFLDRIAETRPDDREPVTTVEEIENKLDWARSDAVHVLSQLGTKGKVGEYRLGRRTHPTRLEWSYKPLSVAACARGEIDDPLPLPEDDDEDERSGGLDSSGQAPVPPPPAVRAISTLHAADANIFRRQLRGGEITVILPQDLTKDEADHAVGYLEGVIALIQKMGVS
jgi:hypothetical protein